MRPHPTALIATLFLIAAPTGAALSQTASASAPSAPHGIKPSEVVVPYSRRIDFTSQVNAQS